MTRLLYTHTDLDGAGCEILMKVIDPYIKAFSVNYGFDETEDFKNNVLQADEVYFTDISVSPSTAMWLNDTGKSLLLLDHHPTAKEKLEPLCYDWIHYNIGESGTLMLFNKIKYALDLDEDVSFEDYENYMNLSMFINDYDLWIHDYKKSKKLQFLFKKIGYRKFVDRFVKNSSLKFTKEEKKIINQAVNDLQVSYEIASRVAKEFTDKEGNKFLYIDRTIGEVSMVSSMLLKNNPDIDYVCFYNRNNTLSLRSRVKDISHIAVELGGGGHPLASGIVIPDYVFFDDISQSVVNCAWKPKWLK